MSYYRRRIRRMFRRMSRRDRRAFGIALAFVSAVVFLAGQGHGGGSGTATASAGTGAPPAASTPAAQKIVSYAKAALGVPYVWGGDGPSIGGGYDCSGLAMEAYKSAGIYIPRDSEDQWAFGPQVSHPKPGDLVFFAGGDGTWSAPGHVGIVVNVKRHIMIDAYDRHTDVRWDTYGLPTSAGGLTAVVGFTDPMEAR